METTHLWSTEKTGDDEMITSTFPRTTTIKACVIVCDDLKNRDSGPIFDFVFDWSDPGRCEPDVENALRAFRRDWIVASREVFDWLILLNVLTALGKNIVSRDWHHEIMRSRTRFDFVPQPPWRVHPEVCFRGSIGIFDTDTELPQAGNLSIDPTGALVENCAYAIELIFD